jgi:hypothetical protein
MIRTPDRKPGRCDRAVSLLGRPGEAARIREWFLRRARVEQQMAEAARSLSGDGSVDDALKGLGYLR